MVLSAGSPRTFSRQGGFFTSCDFPFLAVRLREDEVFSLELMSGRKFFFASGSLPGNFRPGFGSLSIVDGHRTFSPPPSLSPS